MCPGPRIIMGDNAHHPLWGSVTMNKLGEELANFMHNEGLATINDSPTFVRGPTYSSSLDLAFVSRSLLHSTTLRTDMETHSSDHIPTYVQRQWFLQAPPPCIRCTNWRDYQTVVHNACSDQSSLLDRSRTYYHNFS